MLPNASEFLAINANLLKIAFGRTFAREIRYMGEQYYNEVELYCKFGNVRQKLIFVNICKVMTSGKYGYR